jgi:hypothetical protein
MKFITAISTILALTRTTEAIYLACCETTQACPQQYETIDTFLKGDETFNACCYPDEKPNMDDLPQCIHPIMIEEGVAISVMSLPQTKLEPGNGTAPVLMEEITITEGNEEITLTAEITNTAELTSAEEKTPDAAYSCCAVATTVQPALRAKGSSLCPKDMHGVEGLTLNMALLDGARTNVHVCCDAQTKAEDVDTQFVKACANEVTTDDSEAEEEDENHTAGEHEKDGDEDKGNASNTAALSEEDSSNSASAARSAAFGIGALCVLVQTVL